jgi:hypothetical protein
MNKIISEAKNRVKELFGHRLANPIYNKNGKYYTFNCIECNSKIQITCHKDVHIDYNISIDELFITWNEQNGYSDEEDKDINFYCTRLKVLL